MMFLESPALTAPKQDWEAWKAKLSRMNRRDSSVAFALQRADNVLMRIAAREDSNKREQHAVA